MLGRVLDLDRRIAKLAIPALGSIAAEPLYNLADTAIVGHLGRSPLDALAIAASVLSVVAWLAIFLSTATTTEVARNTAQRCAPGGRPGGRRRLRGRGRLGRGDGGAARGRSPRTRRGCWRRARHRRDRPGRHRIRADLRDRPAVPLPVLRRQRAPHRTAGHQDAAADRGRREHSQPRARGAACVRAARGAGRVGLGHRRRAGRRRLRLRSRVAPLGPARPPPRPGPTCGRCCATVIGCRSGRSRSAWCRSR